MSGLSLPAGVGGSRFPGFDALSQANHWDAATRAVVEARLGLLPDIRFFTRQEEAAATALVDQLLDQRQQPRVPIAAMIDARLAEQQTDGWHYATLPADPEAWRQSLENLDTEAQATHGACFADCDWESQHNLLDNIRKLGAADWRGLPAERIWSLWLRYACTAFYSHPWAWNEIGFAGPAYPRGYKNLGLDRLEPFEVRDARPADDPAKRSR